MYFMTVTGNVSGPCEWSLLRLYGLSLIAVPSFPQVMWTMVPSNVAGRTKKTVMSVRCRLANRSPLLLLTLIHSVDHVRRLLRG